MYTDDKNQDTKVIHRKSNNKIIILFIIVVFVCLCLFLLLRKDPVEETKDVFVLQGNDVTLKYKEVYVEPGYSYIDKNNNDLTNSVNVINNVDSEVPGEYEIYYQYKDQILKRKVTVLEPNSYDIEITYDIDKKEVTNKDVIVTYSVVGETFSKLELPDGNIVNETSGSFTVQSNGTYKIIAYNVRNNSFEKEIVIDNIDKEAPKGTCVATLNKENTVISVNASDNNKITQYEYLDNNNVVNKVEANKYTTSGKTTEKISVKIYDDAGNNILINCSITDNRYYEPIKPPTNETVVFKEETDTLKAYISKIGDYYLTRIWVKDAYSQLNKAPSPDYGKELYKPKKLLETAVDKNKLENKLVIGFNTSGFYLKDVYDGYAVDRYPAYNKTSVGTIVITNGKVIRNAYSKAFKQWYITGINKNNQMVIFEDNPASNTSAIANKKKWSETVINSGIRNTFNFAGPVILNGKKLSSFSSSMPNSTNNQPLRLQLICQINDNNFVVFTSSPVKRSVAINKFAALGCKTAVNLDGGGSIALLYKSKNSKSFKTVIGGARAIAEAGYFTE